MSTIIEGADELVRTLANEGPLAAKQAAEREVEIAREDVELAIAALAGARKSLTHARAERAASRQDYEASVRMGRKPRQTNIVRRILDDIARGPATRKQLIDSTGLSAATVSTTLTRLRKAEFVTRTGEGFTGKWEITQTGTEFAASDAPMPKV